VRGTVQLLYADDREVARKTSLLEDGSFAFGFVPDGKYIVEVSGAADADQKTDGDTQASPARTYMDKEIPLIVAGDMEDVNLSLARTIPDKAQTP
jgi:hypothetical protein